jgi:L-seryl-tRNA(Ser) seleniumtransferase
MAISTTVPDNYSSPGAGQLLGQLPQLQGLMECEQARHLCQSFRREDTVAVVRAELEKVRRHILSGGKSLPDFFAPAFFETVQRKLVRQSERHLTRLINATGVALHTNLGRAPLAPEALAAIQEVAAGYCNLEFDLERGKRGSRYEHVEETLCRLTGAEAALVVNNCASAVLLCLMALGNGGEVLVSRGELIEIGGSFRMPDVIAQSGARLVEVGTTNKTRLSDYERAVGEHTRVILKSHPSNYRIVGFAASPERRDLAQLAQARNLVFIEDLGSGTLVDLRRYGLPHEPTVQECLRAGDHIVTFSGDKLLGGPQAGIIVGRSREIAVLKKHPLLRALRIDKLSLAALEATLRLYESPLPPEQRIPVLRMLAENKLQIARRARKLVRELRQIAGVTCLTGDGLSLAGGGSLPETELPTCIVKIKVQGCSANELAARLRQQRPALIGRIADDCFVIDLRTVTPREAREITPLVAGAIA